MPTTIPVTENSATVALERGTRTAWVRVGVAGVPISRAAGVRQKGGLQSGPL